jgi:hypothetical protein
MCITWVDGPWSSEIDGRGVTTSYSSGGQVHRCRMSRGDYRRALESEIRKLNEYEAAERCEVVPIKGKCAGH